MGEIPPPLTSGHLCSDCGGTGADAKKTKALRDSSGGYVMCWTCNGNGLDPAAYFKPYSNVANGR